MSKGFVVKVGDLNCDYCLEMKTASKTQIVSGVFKPGHVPHFFFCLKIRVTLRWATSSTPTVYVAPSFSRS